MKVLKGFSQYINENFIENGNLSAKLQAMLEGKKRTVKKWFEEGLLNNAALVDIQITHLTSNLSSDLIFEFNDDSFYYQVIFSISINSYKEGIFEKGFLKLKKYTMDIDSSANNLKGNLMDEWNSNNPDTGSENGQIDVKDFTPEKILDIISKMEESSQAIGTDEVEKASIETQISQQKEGEF